MELSKEILKVLRADINAALVAVGKRHGVSIAAGNCSFGPLTASFKLEVGVLDGAPEGASPKEIKARADFTRYCGLFDLKPEWLDKEFTYGGDTCTVVGLMPNRSKFPVLVKRGDKRVLLPADAVVFGFQRASTGRGS
jgi:hypothetical protein